MSWIEHRSEIDIEIANCYSQIEELEDRIKTLKAQKQEKERIDKLAKQLSNNLNIESATVLPNDCLNSFVGIWCD